MAAQIALKAERRAEADAEFIKKMGYKPGGLVAVGSVDKYEQVLVVPCSLVNPGKDLGEK